MVRCFLLEENDGWKLREIGWEIEGKVTKIDGGNLKVEIEVGVPGS
jgi:hypothetical protein